MLVVVTDIVLPSRVSVLIDESAARDDSVGPPLCP
jgi:hypothetical protein